MNSTSVISSDEGIQIQPQAFVDNLSTLSYQQDILCIEEVDVDSLVQTYGTPLYVYSKQAILDTYNDYADSFAAIDHQICYSVKANSNLSVLQVLVQAGASFDIVSVGELQRVLAAGGDASKVVFSGVGKTLTDIKAALEAGIGCFNVESVSEIERIQQVAKQLDEVAHISLRVNPNVDAGTHPYISTGLRDNKFGIAHESALEVYQQAAACSHIHIAGIDCHIG